MRQPLPILNLADATYDCTFGRGCDGICCKDGRPHVTPEEMARIDAQIARFSPYLRPEARVSLENTGYVTQRRKADGATVRVVNGWCIFFNQGCVLHRLGDEDGDKYQYKPLVCATFPLDVDSHGRWWVRQHGYRGEKWDLFCLAPDNSSTPAAKSLEAEIEVAQRFVEALKAEAPAQKA